MRTSACASVDSLDTADLTWLMHRASEVLRADFDAVAKAAGLADLRDWLVLSVVTDGIPASTEAGVAIYERVTTLRDAAIAARLGDVAEADQQALRAALWVIASGPSA